MFTNFTHHLLLGQAGTATEATRQVIQENVSLLWKAFEPMVQMIPALVAMLVLVVIGYIAARVFARLAKALCERVGLQHAAERSGLVESMTQVGIKRSVPDIMGQIVFWLLMCVFLMAGFNILQLDALSGAMQTVVAYIPKLLVATVVIVIGLLIANFLRGVIATAADRVGISYAERLAAGCYYVLALMTMIAAFDQLNIEFALLENVILISFGALAVGSGLALGLGGRDVVSGILSGYYVRQRLQSGDHVSVAGLEGTVREVGPVATIVETEENGLVNRHSIPNTKMLNEAVR